MSTRDDLAAVLAENLNKQFKDTDQVAYFLDSGAGTPTDIKEFISEGLIEKLSKELSSYDYRGIFLFSGS